jgi:hypothetical protein
MPRPTEMMRRLARLGAEQRILQLRAEADDIYRQFPELRSRSATTTEAAAPRGQRRRKRAMSVAQRKAVSARMKKYWAARRAAKK